MKGEGERERVIERYRKGKRERGKIKEKKQKKRG